MKKLSKKAKIAIASVVAVAVVAIGIGVAVEELYIPSDKQYTVETIDSTKEEGKIKVGIISDLQLPQVENHLYAWDYMTVTNGQAHFVRALKYFQKEDVDLVVLNGDVANATGDYAAYSAYNKVLDYVYGEDRENMPHFIYPMGNHEFYGGNQEHTYYKATGLPLNARTIIDGYSFISISNSKLQKGDDELAKSNGTLADGTYNPKRIAFLKEQLAAAAKEDPNKPIFVFLHMPIDTAINGGNWRTPQFEEIYSVIKEYPQAVVFTSHSHYCLDDERSIVQKDFTMINTGTASYFDFDWVDPSSDKEDNKYKDLTTQDLIAGTNELLLNKDYMINPQMLGINCTDDVPYRNDVNNGFIMEIDTKANSFTLDKVNLNTGIKFGERFTMDKFTTDSFTRTASQLGQGQKPVFENNSITTKVEGNDVIVTFAAAKQNMPIKYYYYELEDQNGNVTPIRFFGKNYMSGSDLDYNEQNKIQNLEKGTYKLRVYAMNSFNVMSDSHLETTFTIL